MSRIGPVSAMERSAKGLAERRAGCRLRHQPKGVPGRPDYANKRRRVAVFVHGCWWHACPRHGRAPKTNRAFWGRKFRRNAARHREVAALLRRGGWTVVVLWEHDVKRGYM